MNQLLEGLQNEKKLIGVYLIEQFGLKITNNPKMFQAVINKLHRNGWRASVDCPMNEFPSWHLVFEDVKIEKFQSETFKTHARLAITEYTLDVSHLTSSY